MVLHRALFYCRSKLDYRPPKAARRVRISARKFATRFARTYNIKRYYIRTKLSSLQH